MPPHIEQLKQHILPTLRSAGVTRAAVFGSFARGTAGPTSDVDLLIDFPNGKSLLDFVHLKCQLEDAIGRPVDLVEYDALKPALRDEILQTQTTLLP